MWMENLIDHMVENAANEFKKNAKGQQEKQDAHLKAYKKNLRKEAIKKCRDNTKYEKKQKRESEVKRVRIKQIKQLIHDALSHADEYDVAKITCLIDMVFCNHSYRIHVTYMNEHSVCKHVRIKKKVLSKSGLYNWAKNLACILDIVMDIPVAQADRDAYGTFLGYSSGFSIMKYED